MLCYTTYMILLEALAMSTLEEISFGVRFSVSQQHGTELVFFKVLGMSTCETGTTWRIFLFTLHITPSFYRGTYYYVHIHQAQLVPSK